MSWQLDRSTSVCFKGSGVSCYDVLQHVAEIVGIESIVACRELSSEVTEVMVDEKSKADKLLESGNETEIAGKTVQLKGLGKNLRTVFVKGLPLQVPDRVVGTYLSRYGKVQSVTAEKFKEEPFQHISTGVRIARVEIEKEIPNFVWFGSHRVMMSYSGVRKVCRNCEAEGHFAADCKLFICRNCGNEGHKEVDCLEPCRKCSSAEHKFSLCEKKSFAEALKGAQTSDRMELEAKQSVDNQPLVGKLWAERVSEAEVACSDSEKEDIVAGEKAQEKTVEKQRARKSENRDSSPSSESSSTKPMVVKAGKRAKGKKMKIANFVKPTAQPAISSAANGSEGKKWRVLLKDQTQDQMRALNENQSVALVVKEGVHYYESIDDMSVEDIQSLHENGSMSEFDFMKASARKQGLKLW